jgi:hypothetical protein
MKITNIRCAKVARYVIKHLVKRFGYQFLETQDNNQKQLYFDAGGGLSIVYDYDDVYQTRGNLYSLNGDNQSKPYNPCGLWTIPYVTYKSMLQELDKWINNELSEFVKSDSYNEQENLEVYYEFY